MGRLDFDDLVPGAGHRALEVNHRCPADAPGAIRGSGIAPAKLEVYGDELIDLISLQ